jgi:hypothetical protein
MKIPRLTLIVSAMLACSRLWATPMLQVVATNPGAIARPSETIAVAWTEVAQAIPGALLQHLTVKGPDGAVLAYQVTNINPEAKDPTGVGIAYGDILFQHDFSAGEGSASFTIERSEAVAPVFPAKVFARFAPERLDDFAWENDKIAHRTYGPALAAPDVDHTGKEVETESGIDVWCKRVSYLIVDRWYNKGHSHYHKDEGEGMDMYDVGKSRGDGGTGIWDGTALSVENNFRTWKVVANGPIRAEFELTYDSWSAGGLTVTETKHYTVDAGHNLDQVDSTFTVAGASTADLTVGIGLNKKSSDPGQDPHTQCTQVKDDGTISIWDVEKTHGSLGTAVIVPAQNVVGYAEDKMNQLILAKASPGKPLRFYAGAGWSKDGEFTTQEVWNSYLASWAARIRKPVTVAVSSVP